MSSMVEEPEAVTPIIPEPSEGGRMATSGETQACWQGLLDADTCAALGAEYQPPTHEYPTTPDGMVDEGAITENFWNCMAAGGTEESCRQ